MNSVEERIRNLVAEFLAVQRPDLAQRFKLLPTPAVAKDSDLFRLACIGLHQQHLMEEAAKMSEEQARASKNNLDRSSSTDTSDDDDVLASVKKSGPAGKPKTGIVKPVVRSLSVVRLSKIVSVKEKTASSLSSLYLADISGSKHQQKKEPATPTVFSARLSPTLPVYISRPRNIQHSSQSDSSIDHAQTVSLKTVASSKPDPAEVVLESWEDGKNDEFLAAVTNNGSRPGLGAFGLDKAKKKKIVHVQPEVIKFVSVSLLKPKNQLDKSAFDAVSQSSQSKLTQKRPFQNDSSSDICNSDSAEEIVSVAKPKLTTVKPFFLALSVVPSPKVVALKKPRIPTPSDSDFDDFDSSKTPLLKTAQLNGVSEASAKAPVFSRQRHCVEYTSESDSSGYGYDKEVVSVTVSMPTSVSPKCEPSKALSGKIYYQKDTIPSGLVDTGADFTANLTQSEMSNSRSKGTWYANHFRGHSRQEYPQKRQSFSVDSSASHGGSGNNCSSFGHTSGKSAGCSVFAETPTRTRPFVGKIDINHIRSVKFSQF